MSVSGVSCFNQFLVSNPLVQPNWADDCSLSYYESPSHHFDQVNASPFKSDPLLAEQTTYNSGKKQPAEAPDRRSQNPMYSVQEDALIYSKVFTAKNKLSAKKMVAAKLGRSYSGILNRYHILKSLPGPDLEALLARASRADPANVPVSAVIKREAGCGAKKATWRLAHFMSNGETIEEVVRSQPVDDWKLLAGDLVAPGPRPQSESQARSFQRSLQALKPDQTSQPTTERSRRIQKASANTANAERRVRGPYKTKQVRELERIRGQGSLQLSQFMSILITEGVAEGKFTCEDVLENVFEKHRHPSRLIETVLGSSMEEKGFH